MRFSGSIMAAKRRTEGRRCQGKVLKTEESLEQRVTAIEQLPARMDRLELQIVQLRLEMHDEFSAIRQEMQAGDEETRRSLREEIRAGDEETRRSLRAELKTVVAEITAQIEESRRHTRVLFEEYVGRLSTLREAGSTKRGKKQR